MITANDKEFSEVHQVAIISKITKIIFLFSGIPMLEAAMSNAAGSSMLNFASLLSGSGSTADPSIVNKMALMQMMSPNLMNGVPSAASTILQVRIF